DSLCLAIGGSSDFAQWSQSHQSHQAVSSLCRGRMTRPSVLRTIFSFPVALHIPSAVCSYFQLVAGSSATEGLSPSHARSLSSARPRPVPGRSCVRGRGGLGQTAKSAFQRRRFTEKTYAWISRQFVIVRP